MSNETIKYPPGPASKIPGKLIRQFLHDPIKTLTSIAQKYGDISHFKLGPKQHVFLVNNPDYIEKVLIYNHQKLQKGQEVANCKSTFGRRISHK